MVTTAPYGNTVVPVAKSQEELRKTLQKFGATQFSFGEGTDWAGVEFVHDNTLVRVRCPLRLATEEDLVRFRQASHKPTAQIPALWAERETMRVWRVLVWTTKSRLIAVDEGLETFEQSFLAHIVDPGTNRTVWQGVEELVERGALRRGADGMKALGR